MLACLPVDNPPFQFRSHLQMNAGFQKWDTPQKMRSTHYPSPAELDAYAKKVANTPLTIKIFPDSVKVPQRKHIRRTVNGLDTSSQRYSPYASPHDSASSHSGLLAIVRVPVRSVLKGLGATCTARFLPKPIMNHAHTGPYVARSTLPPQQTTTAATHLQGLPPAHLQKQQPPPQQQQQPPPLQPTLQQQQQQPGLGRPQTIQHHGLQHPTGARPQLSLGHQQILQQQQQQQAGLSRAQGLPPQEQTASQGLRLLAEMAPRGPTLPSHSLSAQAQAQIQTLPPQTPSGPGACPPATPCGAMLLGPGGAGGGVTPRKLPDGDAPPNVTVSTSTIPLSMAASLHHNRPSDLSSIVHQINQFCQARAQGTSATSVCEGQIANPSPISRNLLINASSRACGAPHPMPHPQPPSHPSAPPLPRPAPSAGTQPAGLSSCALNPDVSGAPPHAAAMPPTTMATMSRLPLYQNPLKQPHPHSHLQPALPPQQQQAVWKQQVQSQGLNRLVQVPDGPPPCKSMAREDPAGSGFPTKTVPFSQEACLGQQQQQRQQRGFSLNAPLDKATPSPPVNGAMAGGLTMNYSNGHYLQTPQQSWGSVLPTPNSDSSSSQDLPISFHGALPAGGPSAVDCGQGTPYRTGAVTAALAAAGNGHPRLVSNPDYMTGEFPCFHEQPNLSMIGKMPRLPVMANSGTSESAEGRKLPMLHHNHHHPGYR